MPYGSAVYEKCIELRREVLRKPLGFDLSPQEIEADRPDHHLACQIEGEIVACLVLTPKANGEVKMRQVAVVPYLHGRGVGRDLVRFAEKFAIDHSYATMTLHARGTAVVFYLKLGCEIVGDWFEETSIPHLRMQKSLRMQGGPDGNAATASD